MKKSLLCLLLFIVFSYGDTIPVGIFSSGGGFSQTDSLLLYSAIGQPFAGEMTGDNIRLVSGFFDIPIVQQAIINAPPDITSDSSGFAQEGVAFKYKATATDPESILTLKFEKYPSWLAPTGVTLSGTPPAFSKDTSFQVIASDGSLSDTLVVNVTVVSINHIPVITSATEGIATEGFLFSYVATATDPDKNALKIEFENLPSWLKATGDTVKGIPYESAKDTTFLVVASDGLLSDSNYIYVKILSVNNSPVIVSDTSIIVKEKNRLTFIPIVIDPDNTPTVFFKNLPSWLVAKGDTVSGVPGDATKDTSFQVIATDGTSGDTVTISIQIIPVNDPPALQSQTLVQVLVATTMRYVAKYTDPENDVINVKFKNVPSWMTVDNDTIRGTPVIGTPDTSFIITISDGVNTIEQKVTVVVRGSNTPPQITSSDRATATEDTRFVHKITVTDPDLTPLSYKYSLLPQWLSANEDTLFGTPSRPSEYSIPVIVIVSDGLASDTQTILVSIISVNDPPQITSTPDTTVQVKKMFKYQVRAEDEEMGVITYSLINARLGMVIDPSTGLFTWTPADSQAGVANVIIKVTDPEMASDTQSFALKVGLDPKPSCTLTAIALWSRDSIKVQYSITDNYSEPVLLHLYYWTRSNGWLQMEKVIGIIGTIDPGKYTNSFIWASRSELGDVAYDSVKIKVVPESKELGYEVESNIFKCDNTPALVIKNYSPSGIIGNKDGKSIVLTMEKGSRFDTTTLDTTNLAISGVLGNYGYTKTVTDSSLVLNLAQSIVAGDSVTVTVSGNVKDIFGKTLDGNKNGIFEKAPIDNYNARFSVAYLGDFNFDGKVDFRDFPLLSKYWLNSIKGLSADSISEIGPVTGTTPHFILQPDLKFDIQDLGIFVRMWYWCSANKAKVIGPLAKRLAFTDSEYESAAYKNNVSHSVSSSRKPVLQKLQLTSVKKSDTTAITMNLNVENVNHLTACRYTVNYPANTCRFVDANLLMLKATTDSTVLCLQSSTGSSVDLQMVRLANDSVFVSGTGSVAVIKLNKANAKSIKVSIDYEMLNDKGQVIEAGVIDTLIPGTDENEVINDINVFNVAPNPSRSASGHSVFKIEHSSNAFSNAKLNGGCVIVFSPGSTTNQIPLKGLSISITNAFGQEIVGAVSRNEGLSTLNNSMQIYWDLRDQYGRILPGGVYKVRCTWWTSKKKFNSTVLVGVK